jgi:hypothetical protein
MPKPEARVRLGRRSGLARVARSALGFGLLALLAWAGAARGDCGTAFAWTPDASDPEMQRLWLRTPIANRCLLARDPPAACAIFLEAVTPLRDRMARYLIRQYELSLASEERRARHQALNWLFYAAHLDSPQAREYVWREFERGRAFDDAVLEASWRARIVEVLADSGHPRAGEVFLARLRDPVPGVEPGVALAHLLRWVRARRVVDPHTLALLVRLHRAERPAYPTVGSTNATGALLALLSDGLVQVVPAPP